MIIAGHLPHGMIYKNALSQLSVHFQIKCATTETHLQLLCGLKFPSRSWYTFRTCSTDQQQSWYENAKDLEAVV